MTSGATHRGALLRHPMWVVQFVLMRLHRLHPAQSIGGLLTRLAIAGLGAACTSSTAPPSGPTVAGTWHVTSAALSSGTLSPSTFDIVVTPVGHSYVASLPALTWSVGPLVFNTQAHIVPYVDTTLFVVEELPTSPTLPCEFVTIGGRKNASIDSLMSPTIEVFDSDTGAGSSCAPVALAFAVEKK